MHPYIQGERCWRHVESLAMGGTIGAALFLGSGPGLQTQHSSVIAACSLAGVLVFAIMRLTAAVSGSGSARAPFANSPPRAFGVTLTCLGAWSCWLAILLAAMAELTAAAVLVHSRLPRVPPGVTESAVLVALYGIDRLAVRLSPEFRFWMACMKVTALAAVRALRARKVPVRLAKISTFACFVVLGTVVLVVAVLMGPPHVDLLPFWSSHNSLSSRVLGALADFHGDFIGLAWLELVGWTLASTRGLGRTPPHEALSFGRVLIFYLGTLIAAMIALPPTGLTASTSSPWLVAVKGLWPPTLALMSAVLICALLLSTQFMIRGAAQVLRSMADSRRTPAPLGSRDVRGGSMALSTAAISATLLLNCFMPARALGILITAAAVTIAVSFALSVLRLPRSPLVTRVPPPGPLRDRACTDKEIESTNPPHAPHARVQSSTRHSGPRVTPLVRIRSSDVRRSPC